MVLVPGQVTARQASACLGRVQRHVTFTSNTTNGNTSAVDTLIEQVGVCRDFAHMMVALARAAWIPAANTFRTGLTP